MLKKLIIKNFKSLKESEIALGKFNVMVGKNGSGKSNILNCLRFLGNCLKSMPDFYEDNINKTGGYTELIYGGDTKLFIDIS